MSTKLATTNDDAYCFVVVTISMFHIHEYIANQCYLIWFGLWLVFKIRIIDRVKLIQEEIGLVYILTRSRLITSSMSYQIDLQS